jgi:type II secretory pathway component PulF
MEDRGGISMKSKIASTICLFIAICLILTANFLIRVIPKFIEIWEDRNVEMSFTQAIVRRMSVYSRVYWFVVLPPIILFAVVAIFWASWSWGSWILRRNGKSQ